MALDQINDEMTDLEIWSAELSKAVDNLMPLFQEMMEDLRKSRISMGPTGFDAKATRDQYLKKVNTRHVAPEDKPGEGDLYMFISLFLNYGNDVEKALSESNNSEYNTQVIIHKCLQYGIDTDAPQHQNLSLSRIARAFPIHTAAMVLEKKSAGVLPYSSFFKQEVPLVMQHAIFAGLIPAEKFTKELKEITYILNMEISVIFATTPNIIDGLWYATLNMEWISETVGELVESSAKYVDAAINNGIEDRRKLEVLTEAGILEANSDGELELSAGTVALVNKLAGLKAIYSLPYNEAIKKLNSNSDE